MATKQRSESQLERDRTRISQLMLQHYSRDEMADIIENEVGYRLTEHQIKGDIRRVRESWLAEQAINYELLLNQELARIDSMETELWRQLRKSSEPTVKEVIEEYMGSRKSYSDASEDEALERAVNKLVTSRQTNPVNPVYFRHILDLHKERRRLLGLYAPTKLGVTVNQTVTVKGYKDVSPDDWPDAPVIDDGNTIEGEVING